ATGAIMSFIGGTVSIYLIFQKLFFNATLADRPLFTLGILTLFLGIIMIMFGMLGELIMRIYFESTGRQTYMIRSISRKSSK
ncbi:glycosyltransferase, partial [candidate division WWE3 bacterium CG_4_9_14_3_um_filter_34_6]